MHTMIAGYGRGVVRRAVTRCRVGRRITTSKEHAHTESTQVIKRDMSTGNGGYIYSIDYVMMK